MTDCDYCDSSFDDDEEYLRHLGANHYDEIGEIERKRVDELEKKDDEGSLVPYIAFVVVVLIFGGVFYFLLTGGGGGNGTGAEFTDVEPGQTGTSHIHGTIEVVIDGQELDFSRPRYQLQANRFHFESGEGDRWHVHATDVTLGYGMATLGIEIDGNEVSFEGTTYTNATVEVNNESVEASSYVLRDGDHVRIVANETA